MQRAQRCLDLCNLICVATQTVGGEKENLARAQRLRLIQDRVAGRLAHRDPLGFGKGHLRCCDVAHTHSPVGLPNICHDDELLASIFLYLCSAPRLTAPWRLGSPNAMMRDVAADAKGLQAAV